MLGAAALGGEPLVREARLRWLSFPLLALGVGCSTVHGVRPVGKGVVQVDASLGGPVTELFGAPVPLPLSTVGATVGVSDRTNVHAAVHPTGIALFGLVAMDVGVSTEILPPEGARPRLMGDLTVIGAGGDVKPDPPEGGVRVLARPTVTASWDWGKQRRSTVYGALGAMVQPWPGPNAIGTVAVGNLWALGKAGHLTTQVEWIAPYASSAALAPHYYAPGDMGAVSVQVGLGLRAVGGK